jgi:hypothetical protein
MRNPAERELVQAAGRRRLKLLAAIDIGPVA